MGALSLLAPVLVLGLAPPEPLRHTLEARGGFALIDLAVPVAPPLPIFSGDIAWHHTPNHWLAVGARYRTHLGAVHRIGPEAQVRAPWGPLALGATLYLSGSVAGAWQDGVDAGGDLATTALAWIEWCSAGCAPCARRHALRLAGGATVEWLLWEHIAGRSATDVAPHPAYAEFAAEWRYGLHHDAWLTLRGDVAVPLDTDPYAPWGLYPRLTFGGGFGW